MMEKEQIMWGSPSRRTVFALLSGLAAAGWAPRAGAGESGLPRFKRGIGVSHALDWPDVAPDSGYARAPFGAPRFRFDAQQRIAIRKAGFDFVRLAVDPGPFLAVTGRQRTDLDDLLLGTVTALQATGLGVMVDFHPSEMNPAYRPSALTAGVGTPAFSSLLALLERTAGALEGLGGPSGSGTPPLALEVMNEPELSAAAWQPMLEAAYAAARRGSRRLPLVLGGGQMDAVSALMEVDMAPFSADDRLIYTFHIYDPWQFTMQGSPGNPAFVFDEIPYPAPASPDAMLAATAKRIAALPPDQAPRDAATAATRRALESYARSGFGRATLEASFARLAAWRDRYRIPEGGVLLGEFGAHLTPWSRTPRGAEARAAWFSDVRQVAEAHGFGWAAWTYTGPGGFALAEQEVGPGFDPLILRALGLDRA